MGPASAWHPPAPCRAAAVTALSHGPAGPPPAPAPLVCPPQLSHPPPGTGPSVWTGPSVCTAPAPSLGVGRSPGSRRGRAALTLVPSIALLWPCCVGATEPPQDPFNGLQPQGPPPTPPTSYFLSALPCLLCRAVVWGCRAPGPCILLLALQGAGKERGGTGWCSAPRPGHKLQREGANNTALAPWAAAGWAAGRGPGQRRVPGCCRGGCRVLGRCS